MTTTPVPDPRRERGRRGEALAALFLEMQGCSILARNARCADVEVDLIARCGDLLVLAEVKLRGRGPEPAAAALHAAQHARLRRAAAVLLMRHPWAETVRLDVIGIDWRGDELRIRHYRSVGAR